MQTFFKQYIKKYIILLISSNWYIILGIFIIGVGSISVYFFSPLNNSVLYPIVFPVENGLTIRQVAEQLYEEQLIVSPTIFIISTYFVGGKILSGTYHFSNSRSTFQRAYELYVGNENSSHKSIYIPDGDNIYEIADIFLKHFPGFDVEKFIELGIKNHGYLYPDTYYFPEETIEPEYAISILRNNFERRARKILNDYSGPYTEGEIISLAAIIELEAPDKDSREIISGVLINRLEQDIPLQVDVAFSFINGKHTFTLSREDLNIDHILNTYTNKGVPPLPIANPSAESIYAAVHPTKHNYLYFLADFAGTTYFSETYEEHLEKKYIYIDSVLENQ